MATRIRQLRRLEPLQGVSEPRSCWTGWCSNESHLKPRLIAWAAASIGLASAILYLFRTTSEDNSALGFIHYRYVLGRPYSLAVDSNKDGKTEAILYLRSNESDFNKGSGAYFEDWNGDGKFDLRGRMSYGRMIWLELLENGEVGGELLVGKASQDFMRLHSERFSSPRTQD